MTDKNRAFIACISTIALGISGAALAAEPTVAEGKDPTKVEQPITPERAQSAVKEMDALFSRSSAGKQVGESKVESVSGTMAGAEKLREDAKKALAAGNHADAIRLSNEAKKAFFAATRKADSGKVKAAQDEERYKQRADSIGALTSALKQAGQESGKDVSDALKDIEAVVKEANALADAKKFGEGRAALDKAYLAAKLGIESIKRGTTAEAKKDTSPKGVYEYDAFRNETYKSLTAMILDERKKAGVESEKDFLDDVKKGDELRKEGLALGEKKNYEVASSKLGESTSAYKRAVRRAGVQIID